MNFFSYIKSKVNILDIISEYTTLKKAGGYYKGNCPLHFEKTASFTVSPHKEIFYCFGCHQGGDVVSFISKIENLSQLSAAKHLADKYSIQVPENLFKSDSVQNEEEKNKYFKICELVAQWCINNFKENLQAQNYLKNRNLNSETITKFEIGYFPASKTAIKSLLEFAKKNSILAQDLIEANIIYESQKEKGFYSPFEDRIIFPIKDHLGRYCAFGGRIFKEGDTRAKYYNSHEHKFFNKSAILFGLDVAKKSIQAENQVFLVEGYMDAITMSQYGFASTVATLGTACTADHLKILSRYSEKLYVLYDGDQAGQKAILRLTKICWDYNMEPYVVSLAKEHDPASFLTTNGNLKELIENAKDIFMAFIVNLSTDFQSKSLQEKLSIIKELLETIETVKDPIKQDILLSKAATSLEIPFETLKQGAAPAKNYNLKQPIPEPKVHNEATTIEKKLIYAIIFYGNNITEEDEDFLLYSIQSPFNDILKKYFAFKKEVKSINVIEFFDTLNENEKEFLSSIIFLCEGVVQSFNDLYIQFQKKYWKQITNDVKMKIENEPESINKLQNIQKYLKELQDLKQKLLRKGII